MQQAQITLPVPGYRCLRCGYTWIGRKGKPGLPRQCPRCKSASWFEAPGESAGRVLIEPDLFKRAAVAAEKQGVTVDEWIARAVHAALKR